MRGILYLMSLFLVLTISLTACFKSRNDGSDDKHDGNSYQVMDSLDSLLLSKAKLEMYIAHFRKGMFVCNLNTYGVHILERDIDVLEINIDSIRIDGDTIWYYPYFFFLDPFNYCWLNERESICKLIRLKGDTVFHTVRCGRFLDPMYIRDPQYIAYYDSINKQTKLDDLDFSNYPYHLRKDSFERFLIHTQEENRTEFLNEYTKKLKE